MSAKKNSGLIVLISNWKLLRKLLVSLLQWFTNDFVYHGISINIDNLGGNPYFNYLCLTIIELVGVTASHYMLNRFGRKKPYLINFALIAGSLLAVGFIPPDQTWLIVTCVLIAKCSISFNFNALYVITTESYPTVIRNRALSLCGITSQISSTLSPLYVAILSAYWKPLPFLLYGVMSVFAGTLYFLFMSETKDESLPEKMSDIVERTKPNR